MNGFLYAIYFAVISSFMDNSLRKFVTKRIEFKRSMGRGLLDGTDVIRRVNNFIRWFVGTVFVDIFSIISLYQEERERK